MDMAVSFSPFNIFCYLAMGFSRHRWFTLLSFLPCAWRYQPVEQQQSYQISCSMAKSRTEQLKIGGSRHRLSPSVGANSSKPLMNATKSNLSIATPQCETVARQHHPTSAWSAGVEPSQTHD
jgi:hypothetical protein